MDFPEIGSMKKIAHDRLEGKTPAAQLKSIMRSTEDRGEDPSVGGWKKRARHGAVSLFSVRTQQRSLHVP